MGRMREPPPARPPLDAAALHRLVAVVVLGFASGLPVSLTGPAMQAWLTVEGVDIATIGFLSLVGLPYTFKFLWAPLMDRFEPAWLGRRRGWLVLTQLAVAAGLFVMAATSPRGATLAFAWFALVVAFCSASQDVVYDAYRTDLLPAAHRGIGSSLYVLGYRMAMLLSGGLAFIWTDAVQGGGWTWPQVYRLMAVIMVGAAVVSALMIPRVNTPRPPRTEARNDLIGFAAVLLAVAAGFWLTQHVAQPVAAALLQPLLAGTKLPPPLQAKWVDLLALLMGIAITLPLAAWAARKARFETLLNGLANYFSQPQAGLFLAFIVLYKLGDAFAVSLMTPFLLKSMHFSPAEIGVVFKVIGLWLTILGALVAGALMIRLGLWRSLLVFGVFAAASNLGFWWLAVSGKGVIPGITLPAFDWGFVKLVAPTPIDGGLLLVIGLENLASGMSTAAIVAFLMSVCNQRFTATQFALLSAFASVGRVWVGPLAGVLAESIGWPAFFLIAIALAMPALILLLKLKPAIQALDASPNA
jgi:PAT family beta-lactamase induction signal transducer AmpG